MYAIVLPLIPISFIVGSKCPNINIYKCLIVILTCIIFYILYFNKCPIPKKYKSYFVQSKEHLDQPVQQTQPTTQSTQPVQNNQATTQSTPTQPVQNNQATTPTQPVQEVKKNEDVDSLYEIKKDIELPDFDEDNNILAGEINEVGNIQEEEELDAEEELYNMGVKRDYYKYDSALTNQKYQGISKRIQLKVN